jgi:hypothetical protein
MEYKYKYNKPMMKAPYKYMQLIGTPNSGKEQLAAMVLAPALISPEMNEGSLKLKSPQKC